MLVFGYNTFTQSISEGDIDAFVIGLWEVSQQSSYDHQYILNVFFNRFSEQLPLFLKSEQFSEKLANFSLHVLDDFLRSNDKALRASLIRFHDAIHKRTRPYQVEQNWVSIYNTLFYMLIEEQIELCNDPLVDADLWRTNSSVEFYDDDIKIHHINKRIQTTLNISQYVLYLLDNMLNETLDQIGLHLKEPPPFSRTFYKEHAYETFDYIEHLLKSLISSYVLAQRYQIDLSNTPYKTLKYLDHIIDNTLLCLNQNAKKITKRLDATPVDFQKWLAQYKELFKQIKQNRQEPIDLSHSRFKPCALQASFDFSLVSSNTSRLTQRYQLSSPDAHPGFLAKIDSLLSKLPNKAPSKRPTTVLEGLEMLSIGIEALQQKNALLESAFGNVLQKAGEVYEQSTALPSRRGSLKKTNAEKKYGPGHNQSTINKPSKQKGSETSRLR